MAVFRQVLQACSRVVEVSSKGVMATANKNGDPVLKTYYGWNSTPRSESSSGLTGDLSAVPLVHSDDAYVAVSNGKHLDGTMSGPYQTRWQITDKVDCGKYADFTPSACFNGFNYKANELLKLNKTPRFVYTPWLSESGWSDIARNYLRLLAENGLVTPEMYHCAVTPMDERRKSALMVGTARRFYQSLSLMRCVQEFRVIVLATLGMHASGIAFDVALALALCTLAVPLPHIHFLRSSFLHLSPTHLGTLSHEGITMAVRMPEVPHILMAEKAFLKPELFHHLGELHSIRKALLKPYKPSSQDISYRQTAVRITSAGWEKLAPAISHLPLGSLSLAEATTPDFVKELESTRQDDGSFSLEESDVARMYQALEDNRRTATALAKNAVGVLQPKFAAHIDDLLNGTTFDGFKHWLPPKTKGA